MNKAELIEYVAKQTGMTKRSAEDAVNATLWGIKKNVKKGGGVQLVGFGSFTVASRKGRMGRNPQTGEPIKIKPSKTVKFRPGKDFKKML
jgi:DNA-binding protein HU-beta